MGDTEETMPIETVELMTSLLTASHANTTSILDRLAINNIARMEYLEHLIAEVLRTAPYLGTTGEYEACLSRLGRGLHGDRGVIGDYFHKRAELINRGERPDEDPPPLFDRIEPKFVDGWTTTGWEES
jgi:hypothetical protein